VRKFGLELHPEKTRLIEFGRYALTAAKRGKGSRKLNFFGFSLTSVGNHKTGYFLVLRKTIGKRMAAAEEIQAGTCDRACTRGLRT